ncbi:putative transmembrane protein YshB [Oceanobacillus oncorhynchi subsp. incaldanensis]|uniref:Colicin V production protein n=1 Tax=Oceanobacillus oncorhynchi TaxID=545501 RepID=A0A0A1MYU7_9BACI|nr:CvpA family protein [Oceanobacillus oncorhynchi]MDM8100509.1 CvpA family protein [Oceanobacillus oncorhynchi]UUI38276.1 CvpA family protein [Oceanobacillus oncorhynchi]GIO17000.1 putative transmembrane protein YshB [Oceanobacillus oncorhynchi subsp. incaldanensis]CEI83946.1 Colicin V production protein [Oceanobacillus oncorhynchi]
MINLIIIILLLFGIMMGLKRGFVLQLFHLTGFIVAFIVAVMYYNPVAERLSLYIPYPDLSGDGAWSAFLENLPVESAFYNAISFALIFFAVKFILQIIASMLDFVAAIPIISFINKILGAALGFVEIYLISFIILYILALTPVGGVQEAIQGSSLAMRIIEQTPYFSDRIFELWFNLTESLTK